jgi:hypothetical protein
MPALATVVTDFLTAVKSGLSTGSDLATPGSGNIRGAAKNFIRSQDMSAVLELLTGAMDTGTLTATGGTASTLVDGASTFVPNSSQVGNTLTFAAGTTTVALRGLSYVIQDNTGTTLTFTTALAGTPVSGDTYTIEATMVDAAISALRGTGRGLADAPAGSQFAEARIVADALTRLTVSTGGTITERNMGAPGLLTAAGSTTTVVNLATTRGTYRIDELRGLKVTVDTEAPRTIISNSESAFTVGHAYGSAPGAAEAVSITVADNSAHNTAPSINYLAGSQPGDNGHLSAQIAAAQAAVVAFVLPT